MCGGKKVHPVEMVWIFLGKFLGKKKKKGGELSCLWYGERLLIPFFVCVCDSRPQSCLTLCDPKDYSPSGSSVHGILQARMLEWVVIPFSRGIFPTQGSNPHLLHCRQILYHLSHQGSPSPLLDLFLFCLQTFSPKAVSSNSPSSSRSWLIPALLHEGVQGWRVGPTVINVWLPCLHPSSCYSR